MLRTLPATNKGSEQRAQTAKAAGFGIPSFKNVRLPTVKKAAPTRETSGRKRKRISYKEDGQEDRENDKTHGDGSGSDDEQPKKKGFSMGNKEYGADGVLGGMGKWCNRKFPTFEVKDKDSVFKQT